LKCDGPRPGSRARPSAWRPSLGGANPGLGPKQIAAALARSEWGGLLFSPNGVSKALCCHGLNTRAKRRALVAGHRAPYEPPREPDPEPRIQTTHPGELVGIDCFYVGRLHGTVGSVWQVTAIDTYSSFAEPNWSSRATRGAGAEHTSTLAKRVARELRAAGWRLERVLSDNGNELRSAAFGDTLAQLGARHTRIRSGRPQTNGHVERLHRTILEKCWRPAFARWQAQEDVPHGGTRWFRCNSAVSAGLGATSPSARFRHSGNVLTRLNPSVPAEPLCATSEREPRSDSLGARPGQEPARGCRGRST
jgi:transposase InsO family protein